MVRFVLAAAALAAATGLSLPASAIVPCETTDVSCHRTCTLPQYEKSRGIYWNYC